MKQGKEEGLKQGKEEGLKQGEKNEKRKIAKKLLEEGFEIKKISEITGLTIEEIERI